MLFFIQWRLRVSLIIYRPRRGNISRWLADCFTFVDTQLNVFFYPWKDSFQNCICYTEWLRLHLRSFTVEKKIVKTSTHFPKYYRVGTYLIYKNDVMMSAMASQITSLKIAYSTIYSGSKETSKLRVTGLCLGNSPVTGEHPAQSASTAEMFPFDDVIMLSVTTMLSNSRCHKSPRIYIYVYIYIYAYT